MAVTEQETTTRGRVAGCLCPTCLGLQCLDRPRYFSGQLLTETDLNSEQAYALAKQRLHNRYLHGRGVVCGLEVVCHDCEGFVTVKPGYAIDPCGADIVVCREHAVNVIDEIRKCYEQRRVRRRADCEPFRPVVDEGCKDVEEHWCLTIAYDEREGRPTTVLQNAPLRIPVPSSGCGCGGAGAGGATGKGHGHHQGCGCGCQNGGTSSHSLSTKARPQGDLGLQIGACEPTRVLESYRIGVIEEPENECGSLRDRLSETLLFRIIACITDVATLFRKRISTKQRQGLSAVFFQPAPATTPGAAGPGVTPAELHEACCRLRQVVVDLYANSTFNVRCAALRTVDQIVCPTPAPNETTDEYLVRVRPVLTHMFGLLVQYVIDCICHLLLPPCGEDPTEDRLILACVTIRDCKIIRICNHGCRRFAGAFPSFYYWLSIVPITALVAFAVKALCCRPDLVRARSPLIDDFASLLDTVDPTGRIRQSIFAGDFALPKTYRSAFRQLRTNAAAAAARAFLRPDAHNLAPLVGGTLDQARADLRRAKVEVVERQVASETDVPVARNLRRSPYAAPGETVVMYRTADRVLGFGPYDVHEEFVEHGTELVALRTEVTALRDEVERLKKRSGRNAGRQS
jgi:hypothetical protein